MFEIKSQELKPVNFLITVAEKTQNPKSETPNETLNSFPPHQTKP